jgi:6-phosphogluconolactonase
VRNVARPEIEVMPSAASVAERAAELLARYVRDDVARNGRATLAVSGGRTPQRMFEILAATSLPWQLLDVFQVDERIAPRGHADRNATQIAAALAGPLLRHADAFHWMPVEGADLDAAARRYADALRSAAGAPPALGTVHLGLGADGHAASIFPGSPLADAHAGGEPRADAPDGDVAVTGEHLGQRRMTLTLPAINGARRILWVVTGVDKQLALAGLVAGDPNIVGTGVRRSGAVILADADAAALIGRR